MRGWQFISTRNPLWRVMGSATVLLVVGVTTLFVIRGPRPLQPSNDTGPINGAAQGRFGTVTEPLGNGLFVMSYDTITGKEEDLQLQKVTGRLEETKTTWTMDSPAARKAEGVWTLYGPMDMAAMDPDGKTQLGKGNISSTGPALGWDRGVWHGLAPLAWDDLQGSGRGRWNLPAGWYRGLDGKFIANQGPVRWTAAQPGTLLSMDAERMVAELGFKEGHMEEVTGHLVGGQVKAHTVDIEQAWIRYSGPVTFTRDDGWHGDATGGRAPRPPEGGAFEQVDFTKFRAFRAMPGGTESVLSEGARWTPSGLRLEGDVRLEQPLDGKRLLLRAPRVLQRDAPGGDLPADLPVGVTWAEPDAVLTWGVQSLSSPRIEGRQKTRQWKVHAPAYGRGEMGTFSAGEGRGNPARWVFDGPIQAHFGEGSTGQGDALVWENNRYTLTGRPVTMSRFRERLTGPRLVRLGEVVDFPDGIAGALAALDGDINVQADHGVVLRTVINLDGRVEVQGQGWRLQADRISVTLGAGNMVKQVNANGAVFLRGRMGEGRGDALVLDPNQKTATWRGRVKGSTEVTP
ncbi:MAG: hypothetical protein P4L36_03790 [Holophaga sp.]|nr:hypothetical protein [Holophaga sp.]